MHSLFGLTVKSLRGGAFAGGLQSLSSPCLLGGGHFFWRTSALHSSSSSSSVNKNIKHDIKNVSAIFTSLQQENNDSINDMRLQMPRHPHGFRVFPFQWDELRDIVEQDLSLLCRSVPQQYEYEVYKVYLQKHWQSTYDHILCKFFGVPVQVDNESGESNSTTCHQRRAIPLEELPVNFPKVALLPNDFPYYVAPPIQHWVLWVLGRPCTEDDVEWAKLQLHSEIGPVQDFIHWINPPHLQSIPDIDHVHILCLPAFDNGEEEQRAEPSL